MGCTNSQSNECPYCQQKLKTNSAPIGQHKCWKIIFHPPILKSTHQTTLPLFLKKANLSKQILKVKTPANSDQTKFKWISEQKFIFPPQIKECKVDIIKKSTFQEKLSWFRQNLQGLRISWENGSDILKVRRDNILMASKIGIQNLNPHKEIKIQFDDEKVDDAGGLMREWVHLNIKELFSKQQSMGIFQLCDTEETTYKIIWDDGLVKEYVEEYLQMLGFVIGKSIFERISINAYLNRTILRQICCQPVHIQDVYSFDKELYKTWVGIMENNNVEELGLTFSIFHKNETVGKTRLIKLMKDGDKIEVTNENKNLYVSKLQNVFYDRIQQYCTKSIREYLEKLKKGIYRIIPPKYLSIFQPYELQMILYGTIQIDVKDWKANTEYDGYSPSSQIIIWFWEIVMNFSQQKLGHLLHYCTGSRCVPILGFKYLESNRNTITKFKIRKTNFNQQNPYPKSYTCFNRLQLPPYKSYQQLKQKLQTILKTELTNFGLD